MDLEVGKSKEKKSIVTVARKDTNTDPSLFPHIRTSLKYSYVGVGVGGQ